MPNVPYESHGHFQQKNLNCIEEIESIDPDVHRRMMQNNERDRERPTIHMSGKDTASYLNTCLKQRCEAGSRFVESSFTMAYMA